VGYFEVAKTFSIGINGLKTMNWHQYRALDMPIYPYQFLTTFAVDRRPNAIIIVIGSHRYQ